MIHYKQPRHGIDEPIFQLQKMLHEELKAGWRLGEQEYQCYGRAYKNPVPGGFIPEVYKGDGNYHEVLLDDRYTVLSFFGIGDRITQDGYANIAPVHAVFFVHLGAIATLQLTALSASLSEEDKQKVMKSNPARADMEAREAVQAILNQNLYGFTFLDAVTGPTALQEYVLRRDKQNNTDFAKMDMQPFHVFRVNGTIRYPKPTKN